MDIFGGLPLPLGLGALALIDSLSIGTLLIPLFLLLKPGRVRVGRILLYLATIAGFYLLVGLMFLWGFVNLASVATEFLSSPAGATVRLVVGAALLLASFLIPSGKTRSGTAEPSAHVASAASVPAGSASQSRGSTPLHPPAPVPTKHVVVAPRPGRLARWRERLLDPRTRGTAVMLVAIAAGLVEVATMLPYIVAMSALADAGVSAPTRVIALVAYCLVMIVPAVLLLVARVVAAPLVTKPLARLAAWMERTGSETTAWIVGIIGFLILRSAAVDLRLFDMLGELTNRL